MTDMSWSSGFASAGGEDPRLVLVASVAADPYAGLGAVPLRDRAVRIVALLTSTSSFKSCPRLRGGHSPKAQEVYC